MWTLPDHLWISVILYLPESISVTLISFMAPPGAEIHPITHVIAASCRPRWNHYLFVSLHGGHVLTSDLKSNPYVRRLLATLRSLDGLPIVWTRAVADTILSWQNIRMMLKQKHRSKLPSINLTWLCFSNILNLQNGNQMHQTYYIFWNKII